VNAPDTRIHFIVDRNTPYMFVNSGLNILKQFQYRVVSLVVKEGDGEETGGHPRQHSSLAWFQ
jgi:hypothetical protein